jgi:hypothetical protein
VLSSVVGTGQIVQPVNGAHGHTDTAARNPPRDKIVLFPRARAKPKGMV